jgi:hypothetical protein
MAKPTGGGILGNKNVKVGLRTGSPSKGSSPAAAAEIGASTAFRPDQIDAGRGYTGAPYGNQVALNSKSAPGQGRTIHRSGSQSQHGPVAGQRRPMGPDILSAFGPEKSKG